MKTFYLSSFQHITQFRQLLKVLQQLSKVLRKLQNFIFGFLKLRFKVDKFPRIGNPRQICPQIRNIHSVLNQLLFDVINLSFHLITSSHFRGEFALKRGKIGIQLFIAMMTDKNYDYYDCYGYRMKLNFVNYVELSW
jgi:hypothetical protein